MKLYRDGIEVGSFTWDSDIETDDAELLAIITPWREHGIPMEAPVRLPGGGCGLRPEVRPYEIGMVISQLELIGYEVR